MKACQNCAYRGKYRGSPLGSPPKRLYPCAFWSYGVTLRFSCSCWKPQGQGAVQLELFEFESDASDKAKANTELMRWIQYILRRGKGIDLRKEPVNNSWLNARRLPLKPRRGSKRPVD